ncbi:MAG: SIS domain-containing protein [Proteobacteria bacterium]|nr:SIS domain-containing protein [Pseudomonadota bacterium]
MDSFLNEQLNAHRRVIEALEAELPSVDTAILLCVKALNAGHKILLCGNGGSAADAQHIAAELVGRFVHDRKALPAIALTTDSSALTAIGNDYGFDDIFSRQVAGLAAAGDVLIAISTSGNSANILAACAAAQEVGCHVIGLSGKGGGALHGVVDVSVVVPSDVTARIQECHILVGHLLCEGIERGLGLA